MKRLLKISIAVTLSAATVLAPALATAQSSGNGAASSGEGTTRDTNEPAAGAGSGGQTGSMTNGDNAGEVGGQDNAAANISVEQQNEIRSLIAGEKAEPAAADIDVRVGVVVPESGVSLRVLPAGVAKIVPAYRSYQYFRLADGRIVIVAPDSRQAVYILKG